MGGLGISGSVSDNLGFRYMNPRTFSVAPLVLDPAELCAASIHRSSPGVDSRTQRRVA